MIRDEIRKAWADSHAKVIAATVATVLAVPVLWALLVVYLVAFGA